MNPLTNVKNIQKLNERELSMGLSGTASWHNQYKDSAWIFVGGLPYELSEGDIIAVFSQYGEIVNLNLVRDKGTGKSKGYCFVCYEDQRSTILAVDNLNSIQLLKRTIRVDHVLNYKVPKEHDDEDEITKKLKNEGCAPKVEESDESGAHSKDDDGNGGGDELRAIKVKKAKKKKKSKKRHRSSSSSSDAEIRAKVQSNNDENGSDEELRSRKVKKAKTKKKKSKKRHRSSSSSSDAEICVKVEKDDGSYNQNGFGSSRVDDSRHAREGKSAKSVKVERREEHRSRGDNRARERETKRSRSREHSRRERSRSREHSRRGGSRSRETYRRGRSRSNEKTSRKRSRSRSREYRRRDR